MKKIKLFTSLLSLPIIGVCISPLTSCKNNTTIKHTIKLVAGDGGKITSETTLTVDKGTMWKDVRKQCTAVASNGYRFVDWYNGEELMQNDTVIDSDITVTAKFIAIHTLTFDSTEGGHVTSKTSLVVDDGTLWKDIRKKCTYVIDEDGYAFFGWYNGETRLLDDTPINSNMTITATFSTRVVNINFETSSGGDISSTETLVVIKDVKWKYVVNKPNIYPEENYQFDGWYNGETLITDETPMSANMTFKAKFSSFSATKTLSTPIFYVCNTSTKGYDLSGYQTGFPIYHFNNSPCGYISIEKAFGIYTMYFSVETSSDRNKTTITNIATENNSTCVFDHINQTITFSDYEDFIDYNTNSYGPMTHGCNGGQMYYDSVTVNEYVKNSSLTIDLKKYGIRTYCYTDSSNVTNGYMPWEFFKNIFDLTFSVPVGSNDYRSIWDYNGSGLYEVATGRDESYIYDLKAAAKDAASADFYSEEYMEYTYNLLALTLDLRYGMIQRQSRAEPGETINYLEDGAYATLEPYHDQLVSTDSDSSSDALRAFCREQIDDGGHTGYVNFNAFSTRAAQGGILGDEGMYTSAVGSVLAQERSDAHNSVDYYWDYEKEMGEGWASTYDITGYYKEYPKTQAGDNKIAYVTFDTFKAARGYTTQAEVTAGRELPSGTTDINYGLDTLRLTMYANEKIQADRQLAQPTIKNLVIDLSCNGGGTVYTEFFIASWLCGGVREKIYNPRTNSYCDFTVKADINGDGVFNENDYVPSDVKVFVLTSSKSFSCGNILPCNIQDNRPDSIFMGTKSGGGGCYVASNILTGCNSCFQMSSLSHMLRGNSTSTNFITVDDGCSITDGWSFNERVATERAMFNDRAAINNRIWAL